MRYGPEHKTETHRNIVKDASERVRSEGLNGAAVAAVMRDAGLTHGGFYKHFRSKHDLLRQSLHEAFAEVVDLLEKAAKQAPPKSAWKAIVNTYLRAEHCNHPERGCPVAALASELARAGKDMKGQILAEITNYKDRISPFMPGKRAVEKENAFMLIFSTMIGAVEIARMMPDSAAREKLLASTKDFLFRSF